ncbi:hypothetical protein AB0O28_07855 [Microbispora sp. NPDC088329]
MRGWGPVWGGAAAGAAPPVWQQATAIEDGQVDQAGRDIGKR